MAALATAVAVWLLALLIAPFLKPLAWALVIGIATIPHHDRLANRFPRRPSRAAGIMVLVITLCLILPVAALIVMIAQNATEWYAESEKLIRAVTNTLPGAISNYPLGGKVIAWADQLGIDLTGYAAKIASSASQLLLEGATSAAKSLAGFVFDIAVMLFLLFFIYRDGQKIVSTGVARFAVDKEDVLLHLSEIRSTLTVITVGTILTCLAQGALAGIGYFLAGVPAPAIWGALTAVTALVPVVGTAIIWVPLIAYLAITGVYLKAGLLALWCVVFVSVADNAIRPLTIGAKSNIPVPAIVLGAIGGLTTMGLIGLILGPLFFAILAVIWHEATEIDGEEDLAGKDKESSDS